MSLTINKLTNGNVYVDGANFLGRAEEVTLPKVKQKMTDHKGLGLAGELEFWAGGIEKMEGKIKWNSFYGDAFSKTADPTTAKQIMVRGNLTTHTSAGQTGATAYVCYMTVLFKEADLGNIKHMDNAEFETPFAVYSVKLEVGGVEKLHIDVPANIYKVDGVDKLAQFRANIGA